MSTPAMSAADIAAHDEASYVRSAPLPQSAVDAIHRLEARLAALPDGESTVVNGATCTAVSGAVADLLTRHERLQSRCRRLSERAVTAADYEQLLDWHVALKDCRCRLAAEGRLDLIGGA